MTVEILDAGLLATIQDMGRVGGRADGVSGCGAMDLPVMSILNVLLGNPCEAPVLEMALRGLTVRFQRPTLFAVGGACQHVRLNEMPVTSYKVLLAEAGSVLACGDWTHGVYGYLAIAGGWSGDDWLGSQSTDLKVGRGGHAGRVLKKGDILPTNERWSATTLRIFQRIRESGVMFQASPTGVAEWSRCSLAAQSADPVAIRWLRGEHFDWLTLESQTRWRTMPLQLSARSDRMGARLQGAGLLLSNEAHERSNRLRSQPVAPGAVQLPPDGEPLVLLADSQTVGGYPVIAHIAAVDRGNLAQCRPGERFLLQEITLEEAHRLWHKLHVDLNVMEAGIRCL